MLIFLNILTGLVSFLFGFYYGVWFIKRRYLEIGKNLLLVLDCDTYNLDFLTGAGVALNTIFDNKLDCSVKLALTNKIIGKRRKEPNHEK